MLYSSRHNWGRACPEDKTIDRYPFRRHRRTRIVATLGPASSDPAVLARLFEAGADIFRLNVSHGTQADHAASIRALEARERRKRFFFGKKKQKTFVL